MVIREGMNPLSVSLRAEVDAENSPFPFRSSSFQPGVLLTLILNGTSSETCTRGPPTVPSPVRSSGKNDVEFAKMQVSWTCARTFCLRAAFDIDEPRRVTGKL